MIRLMDSLLFKWNKRKEEEREKNQTDSTGFMKPITRLPLTTFTFHFSLPLILISCIWIFSSISFSPGHWNLQISVQPELIEMFHPAFFQEASTAASTKNSLTSKSINKTHCVRWAAKAAFHIDQKIICFWSIPTLRDVRAGELLRKGKISLILSRKGKILLIFD